MSGEENFQFKGRQTRFSGMIREKSIYTIFSADNFKGYCEATPITSGSHNARIWSNAYLSKLLNCGTQNRFVASL